MIPELAVIVVFIWAGCGSIVYAITRQRRKARALFGWLAVPCFTISGLYIWFLVGNVALQDRIIPLRLTLIIMGVFIAVITSTVAYLGKVKHEHRS